MVKADGGTGTLNQNVFGGDRWRKKGSNKKREL